MGVKEAQTISSVQYWILKSINIWRPKQNWECWRKYQCADVFLHFTLVIFWKRLEMKQWKTLLCTLREADRGSGDVKHQLNSFQILRIQDELVRFQERSSLWFADWASILCNKIEGEGLMRLLWCATKKYSGGKLKMYLGARLGASEVYYVAKRL